MESIQQRPVELSCRPISAVGLALGVSALAAYAAGSVARRVRSEIVAPSLPAVARRGVARLLDRLVPVAVAEVLRRVDLTEQVLDAVDLPEIVRQSTGAMASGFVRRTRVRGIAADEAVGRVRNRLLRRPTRGPA